jgi:hypothetical protein
MLALNGVVESSLPTFLLGVAPYFRHLHSIDPVSGFSPVSNNIRLQDNMEDIGRAKGSTHECLFVVLLLICFSDYFAVCFSDYFVGCMKNCSPYSCLPVNPRGAS